MTSRELLLQESAAVFFHAPWSGPSAAALKQLRQVATVREIPDDAIRVIDVEVEPTAADILKEVGFAFDGWGESIVIRGGRVVYFDTLGRGSESLEARVAKFLDAQTA